MEIKFTDSLIKSMLFDMLHKDFSITIVLKPLSDVMLDAKCVIAREEK